MPHEKAEEIAAPKLKSSYMFVWVVTHLFVAKVAIRDELKRTGGDLQAAQSMKDRTICAFILFAMFSNLVYIASNSLDYPVQLCFH